MEILEVIARPLGRRIGTFLAGGLVVLGANAEQAAQIETLTAAVVAVMFDVTLSIYTSRRSPK